MNVAERADKANKPGRFFSGGRLAWYALATCLAVSCLCAAATPLQAEPLTFRADVPESDWLLVPEPKFMRPEVSWPLEGSERTVMAAAFAVGNEVETMSRRTFQALGVSEDEFLAKARENLMTRLDAARPEMIRDSDGVLQCVLFRGDDQALAGLMFAPGLVQRYDPVFGPELVVIAPRRSMLFVFPKLASRFEEFATDVLMAYKNTPHPVSPEVFEVDAVGARAVGIFEE